MTAKPTVGGDNNLWGQELNDYLDVGHFSDGRTKLFTPTAVKTSSYTAAVLDFVPVDTTSGAVTITLPTAPVDGALVAIKHILQGSTNAVTIACGGSDVINRTGGVTSDSIPLLGQGKVLMYKSSGAIWYIIATDTPLLGVLGQPAGPGGLTGSVAAARFVGGTASGAPTTGAHLVGDFVIEQTGKVYVCTAAGTPGTWVQAGGGSTLTIGAVEALFTAAGKILQGTGSGTGAEVFPPAYEFGHDAQASTVNIASTTEATGTTIIAGSAHTFDGGLVMAHFWAPSVYTGTAPSTYVIVSIFEGSTEIVAFGAVYISTTVSTGGVTSQGIQSPYQGWLRFTPSAGSHTYKITAMASSLTGTPAVAGGCFLRFTKV